MSLCQEALLPGDATPVLLAVVCDSASAAALGTLHRETEWRGGTPRLQVVDEATWSAVQELAEKGLITYLPRAVRHLIGEAPSVESKPTLTEAQIRRIAELRTLAEKEERVARFLGCEGLEEEAAPHRQAAEEALREVEGMVRGIK